MAQVIVRYFGILRELARVRSEKIKVEDQKNLSSLLETIASKHDSKFRAFLYSSTGKLNSSLAFAIDGDSIPTSKLRSMKCGDVKEFAILPPISGG